MVQQDTILAESEDLRRSLGFLANTYLIAPTDFSLSENSSLTLLSDLENNFKAIYKAKAGRVYLIRPAYQSDKLNSQEVLNYFKEIGMRVSG
ncbi:hypothetical protein Lgra_1592 [Legionella gratiana]|uniref:Uncharacterized protein n=1 Tax=Legionella gratiana TaxID=45066 RepID=A0A378J6Z8_9GAMM|nr:hypothetical protein [Legionella gratiana]KTD10626.1 hypothetical protein Lgra_1592 [Legionella gratiana]STX43563.1 Uncharacterised protein [Legionella gratiana]